MPVLFRRGLASSYYPHKAQSHELKQLEPGDNADLDSFMAFVKSQIKEIAGAGL